MVMKKKSKETTTTACCSKVGIKRGPWTAEEDDLLASYVRKEGEGRWRTLPKRAGLSRCGKSCRLRWMNYLRPSVKRGHIAPDEEDLILRLHRLLGNRWSLIAGRIPGRTDNEIKNYWNTHLSKKLISQGIDPRTHKPFKAETPDSTKSLASTTHNPNNHVKQDDNEEQRGKTIQSNDIQLVTGTSEFNAVDDQVVNNNFENYIGETSTSTLVLEDDDVFSSFLNSLINEDANNSIGGIAPFTDHPFLHG